MVVKSRLHKCFYILYKNQQLAFVLIFYFMSAISYANQSKCRWESINFTLINRMNEDQSIRSEMQETLNPSQDLLIKGALIDQENTEWLRSVIQSCGWPQKKDVGEMGAFSAWILAQHSDMNLIFQGQAVEAMKIAVLNGQADRDLYSKLLNRYSTNLTKLHQSDVVTSANVEIKTSQSEILKGLFIGSLILGILGSVVFFIAKYRFVKNKFFNGFINGYLSN